MDMIISGENLSISVIWKIIENYKKLINHYARNMQNDIINFRKLTIKSNINNFHYYILNY